MKDLTRIQQRYIRLGVGDLPASALANAAQRAGYLTGPTTERGMRATPENALRHMYQFMWVDPALRAKILDIRHMDQVDGRVKKLHARMARTAVKGGLKLKTNSTNKRLIRAWNDFVRRLQLARQEKLESDARGLAMEGNLPLQWVLDAANRVVAGIRMPSETLVPRVSPAGVFQDPRVAYEQYDLTTGQVIAKFALWQLSLVRLTPDNYDDLGCMGRPYLDASRAVWRKLAMTEEDLVIRRKMRAPLRLAHVLEGATREEMDEYQAHIEAEQARGNYTDYYLNRKGSISAIQGDANLDQIADVAHLLDTFYAGGPAPKGLFGYAGDLSRDILEDLKRDYYDEIDALQDTQSYAYELGFRLHLLLSGINPDSYEFGVQFAERRTDTPNQRADLALKLQALGASRETAFEVAGRNPTEERARLEAERDETDPYPEPTLPEESANRRPRVSVTPGNQRKGESATTISTRSPAA